MIRISDLTYQPSSKGAPIFDDFSLQLDHRQLTVLLGESGTGKSTLGMLLAGLLEPQGGEILVNGAPLRASDDVPGFLHQNPEYQILGTSVERDIAYTLENRNVPRPEMHQRVEKLLQVFDLVVEKKKSPSKLSGGEQQRTALAGLLSAGHSYIILDEPTSYLDQATRDALVRSIMEINRQGIGILWITQYPEEARIGDSVYLLEEEDVTQVQDIDEISLQGYNNLYAASENLVPTRIHWEKPLVAVSGLSAHPYGDSFLIEVPCLQIHEGERQGWYGASGTGKSTLAKQIVGILQDNRGKIHTHYDNHEVVYVPQFAEQMLYGGTLEQSLPLLEQRPDFDRQQYQNTLHEKLNLLGIHPGSIYERPIWTFSGGEQRRIILAIAFALQPKLLILDEPTIGISPGDRKKINQLFTSRDVSAIIYISHEYEFLKRVTHTGVFFENGSATTPSPWDVLVAEYNLQSTQTKLPQRKAKKLFQTQ